MGWCLVGFILFAVISACVSVSLSGRMAALRERTGAPGMFWLLDSPVCLILTQGWLLAGWLFHAGPERAGLPFAITAAVLLGGGALVCGIVRRRLHPYIVACALALVWAGAGHVGLAVAIGAALLVVMQGYEARLWRLLGEVKIWGRGNAGMLGQAQERLTGVMYVAATASAVLGIAGRARIGEVVTAWSSPSAFDAFTYASFGGMIVLGGEWLLKFVPPFTLPGLNWVQGRLASWTFSFSGHGRAKLDLIRWWL